jgi:hypothetical protein
MTGVKCVPVFIAPVVLVAASLNIITVAPGAVADTARRTNFLLTSLRRALYIRLLPLTLVNMGQKACSDISNGPV